MIYMRVVFIQVLTTFEDLRTVIQIYIYYFYNVHIIPAFYMIVNTTSLVFCKVCLCNCSSREHMKDMHVCYFLVGIHFKYSSYNNIIPGDAPLAN